MIVAIAKPPRAVTLGVFFSVVAVSKEPLQLVKLSQRQRTSWVCLLTECHPLHSPPINSKIKLIAPNLTQKRHLHAYRLHCDYSIKTENKVIKFLFFERL
ncbi:hypothetical protein BB468_07875 [Helicobacter pylori]|uniref:Secreted protein n=1 Tax=Helicobacter pylori TaxID=210 RepID=A0AB36S1B7_HELPX|nr:hypothetical protein BB468_07875 [Helicobacter pylori]